MTTLTNRAGLRIEINANGSIRRIDCGDIIINMFLGNEVEGGLANLYLRRLGRRIESTPLLGPRSPGRVVLDENGFAMHGEWRDLRFAVGLRLPPDARAWRWHVHIENVGLRAVTADLIYAQDLALAHYGMVRLNEYYVSQYVDFTPLQHATHGSVLAVRQNLAMGSRHPWVAIGSLHHAVGYATDAFQLYETSARSGACAPLLAQKRIGTKRLQREHAMAIVQDAAQHLAAGETAQRGFFGWFEEDHPAATSDADLALIDRAISLNPGEGQPPDEPAVAKRERLARSLAVSEGMGSLFTQSPLLASQDLTDAELSDLFPGERRHIEQRDGRLQSFFTAADAHVVLKDKELLVLRPHGHILRTGNHRTPDEASLTSTVWMDGVFNSMVTQGHVSINRFLSTTHTYLGVFRSHGQRIFVGFGGSYVALGVPSAFAMTARACRWLYKYDHGLIEIRTEADGDHHQITLSATVLHGTPLRFLVSHHIALNGDDGEAVGPARYARDGSTVIVRAITESDVGRRFVHGSFRIQATDGTILEQVGGDELLFADRQSRQQPFVTVITAPSSAVGLKITGQLVDERPPSQSSPVRDGGRGRVTLSLPSQAGGIQEGPSAADVARLHDLLPWLEHDALVHYLAPRGLEQYSGGGWGTRDVCQGPVEMLLAFGEHAPVRDLLLRVFAAQNPDGDWPQWFMFFERERNIRPNDSHGDIVFWPLLALGRYLLASNDTSILDEVVPFFHADTAAAESAAVSVHVERALDVIAARVISGTHLAAYGHGDWNDSLQPVDPAMRERLCSAWTVTLHHETLTALATALEPHRPDEAQRLQALIRPIRADFQRLLIVGGVLTGFAHFHDDGERHVDYLLHPRDDATGIRYRLLPMIHAILNGMLTPAQAKRHVKLIQKHLLGPDGARLFDRPPRYSGGPQRYFQRAESSTFFGREIGLMYMHAHLRYAQAMAYYGDADAFYLALRQANPIGLDALVATAQPRQANCYYSSSDAGFADRYDAAARYPQLRRGKIPFEGGWRVYSSGAGIMVRLLLEHFLGLQRHASTLIIDPVMPSALDGLRAEVALQGHRVAIVYRVGPAGCSPSILTLNDSDISFERETNPYRTGGAVVSWTALQARLLPGANTLVVQLG